jgi:hypothetical protein
LLKTFYKSAGKRKATELCDPATVHVNKVLVHEEAVVFHYDDIDGADIVFALDIGKRDAIKVLWNEKVFLFSEA